ncbi:MAG TPA: DUF2279 domain-containing protein [Bacteroidia bacterium]|nr:DUF2279 domain-containing protein [Bacteroidia bacterium]
MMRSALVLIAILFPVLCHSQIDTLRPPQDGMVPHPNFFQPAISYNKKRTAFLITGEAVLSTGTLIGLSQLWYKDYPRSKFHSFNDNSEWLQMDKCGHAISAYTVGRYGMRLLEWGGVEQKKAIWYGGLTGFAYQGVIEVFDGFSSGWGFSVGDISANAIGSGILIGQELLWKEQRVTLKFSFHKSTFPQYRPDLLGSNWNEQLIKDYNAQTYWLSFNISSFLSHETKFPKFLNLALGYGATGMTGGKSNPVMYNSSGNTITFERARQYYLSFDLDLTKIPTHSPFLKAVFETIGFLKIPAPGIEFGKNHFSSSLLMY